MLTGAARGSIASSLHPSSTSHDSKQRRSTPHAPVQSAGAASNDRAHLQLRALAERANILPLKGSPTSHNLWEQPAPGRVATGVGAPPPAAAHAAVPRVLQIQTAAELQHLLACHRNRLLVVYFSAAGCPLNQAFQPLLRQACRQHPEALFLSITMQPNEISAAATDLPAREKCADRVQLLHELGIGQLPCIILMQGQALLSRLEVSSGTSSSGGSHASAATAGQPAEAVAAAAAHQLEAALLPYASFGASRSTAGAAPGVAGAAVR